MDILFEVERLINYAIKKELIDELDYFYYKNLLIDILNLSANDETYNINEKLETATNILENISSYAIEKDLINNTMTEIDLFSTKIMGLLMPIPSTFTTKFLQLAKDDKVMATDYFYNISKDSNYIMVDRVKQNKEWQCQTSYGDYIITINVSKPEKTPEEIIKAKSVVSSGYPKCLLCKENVGFAGNLNHPARQNLRTVPLSLNNEKWHMQYSPYVYYNEHCIVFKDEHSEMKITHDTFPRLLDFVEFLPHYFIGSNADLPIVGGSILSHDHFQGGNYTLPMAKAKKKYIFDSGSRDFEIAIVDWAMSVIRITGKNKKAIIDIAIQIFDKWINYNAENIDIISHTGTTRHNTVNPIARMNEQGEFLLDIVLRNNRTSSKYPDGIFHTHKETQHIKQENIGLIEVMGLGILPKRLIDMQELISKYLTGENKDEFDKTSIHYTWVKYLLDKYGTENSVDKTKEILENEIGLKFAQVLVDCGVFKDDELGFFEFKKFVNDLL